MKTRYTWMMLMAGALGVAPAQMPAGGGGGGANVPSSFDVSGAGAKPASNDPNRVGETPNPQLLGMELPLLDPSSDTVKYNGGHFDVGNNAAVRAKFETYLHQVPDNSAEFRRYRNLIREMMNMLLGKRSTKSIGNKLLSRVGQGLREANEFPGDNGQAGILCEAMAQVLESRREVERIKETNVELDKSRDEDVRKANDAHNNNIRRKSAISNGRISGKAGAGKPGGDTNSIISADRVKKAATKDLDIAANKALITTNQLAAKVNYQSTLISLLVSRYFDHVSIGTRVYRQLFPDGDSRMNLKEGSKAYEMAHGGVGLPPTVNGIATLAKEASTSVERNMQAVNNMLVQNKLGQATQHLIEAVAIGEHMESVATFATEGRQRIAAYWTLRKRALTALNARDYDTVEAVAKEMKSLDAEFDDSMLMSYTSAKKSQSDMALRNAQKAMKEGREEDFNRYIQEAAIVWPRNPRLEEGKKVIEKIDGGDDVKDEFRRMYAAGEFRRIARDEERFEIVAMDPELKKQYKDALALVMKMDGIIEQLRAAAEQDVKLGPCAAYEKMIELQKEDERYAADEQMRHALHEFESRAHNFVDSLREAEKSEERSEYGSALSSYFRAQGFFPQSKLAAEAIRRVMSIIVNAQYD